MGWNNPDQVIKGYISPIRGRRKSEMSEQKPPITPHENDILMGRGGKNNQHSGNNQLRALARQQCQKYRVSSKKGKSSISRDLVKRVRAMNPPARFLKKNNETGLWEDVGDEVAREKASQALRDAVALELSEEQADEEEGEEEEEEPVEPIPASQAFRRTVSAPPTMDNSPNEQRRKTWPVQERRQQHRKQRHETPQYPPVTPASQTASAPAKRRRYYEEGTINTTPWMYQPEQPPYGSPDFVASRSNPEFHRPDFQPSYTYPMQQQQSRARQQQHYSYPQQQHYPQQQQQYRYPHPGATYSMSPPVQDEDDFDLFNGQLLEPGTQGNEEEKSLERRSDTF